MTQTTPERELTAYGISTLAMDLVNGIKTTTPASAKVKAKKRLRRRTGGSLHGSINLGLTPRVQCGL